jgi:hypothetical protein
MEIKMDQAIPPPAIEFVANAVWQARISRSLGSRHDADVIAQAAIEAWEEWKKTQSGH